MMETIMDKHGNNIRMAVFKKIEGVGVVQDGTCICLVS